MADRPAPVIAGLVPTAPEEAARPATPEPPQAEPLRSTTISGAPPEAVAPWETPKRGKLNINPREDLAKQYIARAHKLKGDHPGMPLHAVHDATMALALANWEAIEKAVLGS